MGAHYQRLQDVIESLGTIGQNWKVEAIPVSAQQQGGQVGLGAQRDASTRPLFGTINVILAAPRRMGSRPSKVLSIAQPSIENSPSDSKRSRVGVQLALSFFDEDKLETL